MTTANTTFELVRGSGSSFASTIYLDSRNCSAEVWWCEKKQEYPWMLVWEDGTGPYSTHVASGSAPTKTSARAEMVKHMMWAEDNWPRHEYFDGP